MHEVTLGGAPALSPGTTEFDARTLPCGAGWAGYIRAEALHDIRLPRNPEDIPQAWIANTEPVYAEPRPGATNLIWRSSLSDYVVVLIDRHVEGFTTFCVSLD